MPRWGANPGVMAIEGEERSGRGRGAGVDGRSGSGGPVLELRGVTKSFHQGGEVWVLDRVDLVIGPGEFCSLVGPSGSGRSTLLHLAGGIDQPDQGEVFVQGVPLASLHPSGRARLRWRQIGFVFQFFQLLATLTVEENVGLPMAFDGRRAECVGDLLERLGLASKSGRYPSELSGGEMQRVAIARALVAGAPLILADEPTGNLDGATGREVLDLLGDQVRRSEWPSR